MTTLAQLRSSKTVVLDLAEYFDLDLRRTIAPKDLFILSPGVPYDTLASKKCGDLFLCCGDGNVEQRPVLAITHEGQAGRLASSLDGLLGLVLALPWWEDVLHFSGGGNLAEMRRPAEASRTEANPELHRASIRVASELGVRLPDDPVAALYREVNTMDVRVLTLGGTPFDSMLGAFRLPTRPGRKPAFHRRCLGWLTRFYPTK